MVTLRVLPRRGTTRRALLATVEVTGVLALGHVLAGGSLPSLPWLGLMAAAVLGAGLLVLHGRVRPAVAVPALVGTQLLLHAWLTALTPAADPMASMQASMQGAGHEAHVHAALDPAMLAVHVAGGLLCAVLWELRARAAEVVVGWVRQPLPPVPAVRRPVAPAAAPAALVSRVLASAAPRRGPPAGCSAA
ncbi:hypothetical protein [Nocardioides litoris]|uniref:hypothetical protein n=1 Tax=Nocardioides litoris TaxID=1926648 RepID=UPI00111EBCD1|nr:hypothetical protein [Nocardioides litoris]